MAVSAFADAEIEYYTINGNRATKIEAMYTAVKSPESVVYKCQLQEVNAKGTGITKKKVKKVVAE